MNPDSAASGCRPGPAIQALLGILVLVVGLLGLPAEQYIGDPQAVRMVAWSLLERGRLDVPTDLAQDAGERGQYFVQNPDNGLFYSKYGELNSLGYLPAMALERSLLGRLEPFNDLATRTVLLNLNNLALSLVLAGLLLALACLFTRQPALALVWVLATLYASFGWNYLRAQTTELLQWTLCTGFFWALFQLWRSRGHSRWLGAVHLFLVGLLLTKAVYVLLVPCLLLVGILVLPSQTSRPRALLGLLGPLVLMALLVLGLNELKFGSPWSTGYTQWVRERDLFRGGSVGGPAGVPGRPPAQHLPVPSPPAAGPSGAARVLPALARGSGPGLGDAGALPALPRPRRPTGLGTGPTARVTCWPCWRRPPCRRCWPWSGFRSVCARLLAPRWPRFWASSWQARSGCRSRSTPWASSPTTRWRPPCAAFRLLGPWRFCRRSPSEC